MVVGLFHIFTFSILPWMWGGGGVGMVLRMAPLMEECPNVILLSVRPWWYLCHMKVCEALVNLGSFNCLSSILFLDWREREAEVEINKTFWWWRVGGIRSVKGIFLLKHPTWSNLVNLPNRASPIILPLQARLNEPEGRFRVMCASSSLHGLLYDSGQWGCKDAQGCAEGAPGMVLVR